MNLHRKLSDVDDDCGTAEPAETASSDTLKGSKEADRLKELESVARRAEETSSRNAERIGAERARMEACSTAEYEDPMNRRYKKLDAQHERRRQMELFQRKSKRLGEEEEDQYGGSPTRTTERNFLNRLRIKRRSMKLLSFLSGKAADRSQEERAARLLRMYMPEKGSKAQNTISIHHTSRDRRFWKLRSRRRTNSS